MLEALVEMRNFAPFEDNAARLSTVILALYRLESYCQISVIKIGKIGVNWWILYSVLIHITLIRNELSKFYVAV